MKKVAIIGAGITGLCAAYALRKLNQTPLILESTNRVGGVIQTYQQDDFLAEAGPHSLALTSQSMLDFIESIGLGPEVQKASPKAKNRFIVRQGKLTPVPQSLLQFIGSPALSIMGKCRLFAEPFIKAKTLEEDESVADFFSRRFGQELLEYAVDPFISGIYAGDPKELSISYAFPQLKAWEARHKSVVQGFLKETLEKKRQGRLFKREIISFRNGMHTLPKMLAVHVKDYLHFNTKLERIVKTDEGWSISWREGGELFTEEVASILSTVPAYRVEELPFEDALKRQLNVLREIPYAGISLLTFGFRKAGIRHSLRGLGMLVPQKENYNILGTLFSSSMFAGRAPKGYATLATFVGGMRQSGHAAMPFEDLKHLVLNDLESLLGATGQVVFANHSYWPRGIPQYTLHTTSVMQALSKLEESHPGLFFAGNFCNGVALGQCMEAGLDTGSRMNDFILQQQQNLTPSS
tara:strand:- start:1332 stop:2729 length:1398 start_codon:yes stop_codon:yes gene_type:complete